MKSGIRQILNVLQLLIFLMGLGTHFTDQRSSALSARSLQHLHLELNTARAQGQLLLSLIQLNLYSSTLLELNLYSSTFLQLNL